MPHHALTFSRFREERVKPALRRVAPHQNPLYLGLSFTTGTTEACMSLPSNVIPFDAAKRPEGRQAVPSQDDMMARIGAILASSRRAAGLSLNAVAADVGTSPAQIARYEAGSAVLTVSGFLRLATVLGYEPADLFGEITADLERADVGVV